MELLKYNKKEKIIVNTPKELKELLKYCNPTMIRHYQNQLPQLEIKGFGESIEIIRKQV